MPVLEMRTSERAALKQCAQKWWWQNVEGLTPVRAANPLWFGSAVHEGLAGWYLLGSKRGPHPAETFSNFLEGDRSVLVTNEDEEQQYVDARQMGIDMLERYVNFYGKDDDWEVIAVEKTFQILMKRKARTVFGVDIPALDKWLRYVGTIDGVYRNRITGEIWLMEHKTAASIRVDHLPLDDQAGSYWALAGMMLRKAGLIGPKEEIAGITYNFLRKAPDDPRPKNEEGLYTNKPVKDDYIAALDPFYELTGKETAAALAGLAEEFAKSEVGIENNFVVLGEVSKSQPPAYFERFPVYRSRGERQKMLDRIRDEAFFAEAYRSGDLPVTKSPSKDCAWCSFNRMCQLDESGDQIAVDEFKETQFVFRDPYAAHQKKSAES